MGMRMLNTKIRAFSFVVHLIGELGGHITLPTLKKSKIKIFIPIIVTRPVHGVNSRFLRDVTTATLVYRTIAKKVFWEFDSIIMQNLSDILPLFCTPTCPSHHVSENQELTFSAIKIK